MRERRRGRVRESEGGGGRVRESEGKCERRGRRGRVRKEGNEGE